MKTFDFDFEPFTVQLRIDDMGYSEVVGVIGEDGKHLSDEEAQEVIENFISEEAIDRKINEFMRSNY